MLLSQKDQFLVSLEQLISLVTEIRSYVAQQSVNWSRVLRFAWDHVTVLEGECIQHVHPYVNLVNAVISGVITLLHHFFNTYYINLSSLNKYLRFNLMSLRSGPELELAEG